MASSAAKVYVANIPYDLKEDALRRILERAGPIVAFDLMKKDAGHLDREHNGVGWCTYGTPADAQNAIRLLNGFHIQNRALRVAPSEKRAGPRTGFSSNSSSSVNDDGSPRLPAFEVVKGLSPVERWEILYQFQELMARKPRLAREILVDEPQIAQGLSLINQFVRGGRQQGAPVATGAAVGLSGGPPMISNFGVGVPGGGRPAPAVSSAPQFILNSGPRAPGRPGPAGFTPAGRNPRGNAFGGNQGSGAAFAPRTTSHGAPIFYAGAGSGGSVTGSSAPNSSVVQTISRGHSAGGGQRGGRAAGGAPAKRPRRSGATSKKPVDNLL